MKKRLLCALLALCMLLPCLPRSLAAEAGSARDTSFFTDQYHARTDFADMAYVPVSREDFDRAQDKVRALIGDPSRLEEARAALDAVISLYELIGTDSTLLNILTSRDTGDQTAARQAAYHHGVAVYAQDQIFSLLRDVLRSPCADAASALLTPGEISYYLNYTGMTGEQEELYNAIYQIQNDDYWDARAEQYTAVYQGRTWTESSAQAALASGDLSRDGYAQTAQAIARARNAALGELYLEELELNQQLAASFGFDSYADYAYAQFGRDYTPGQIRSFFSDVKRYILPVYQVLSLLYAGETAGDALQGDYTGDETLALIRPYLAQMSDELLEAYDYMLDHHLYDIGPSPSKSGDGFTTILSSYGAPFFFNSPNGDLYDFTTILHEFGHYNHFYWHGAGWNDANSSVDVSEVHSQALELLFLAWYPQIFGSDAGAAQFYVLYQKAAALVSAALYSELELYAASTPGVTLRQLNQEFFRLMTQYGLAADDGSRDEMYDWVLVPHLTIAPMYYVSYCVSAAGAFDFWLEAQDSYPSALDRYLAFSSLPCEYGFRQCFRSVGMDDPLSAGRLRELSGALTGALDLERRVAEDICGGTYFSDVSWHDGAWYYGAVQLCAARGLMDGVGGDRFDPDGTATRAMAAALLWRLDGRKDAAPASFSDVEEGAWYQDAVDWAAGNGIVQGYGGGVFDPGGTVTREQFATMLYRCARKMGLAGDGASAGRLSDFPDGEQAHAWAAEAVGWCTGTGILSGDGGGRLQPGRSVTRAEMAAMLSRFCALLP